MKKRVWILFSAFAIVLVGICCYISTINMDEITQVAGKQSSYAVSVASLRGTIYDRNMQPLVNTQKEYRAAVAPDETLLTQLRPAMSESGYTSLKNTMRDRKPALVHLNRPVAITENIRQFLVPVRYGDRLLAPHLIGYLNMEQSTGITGIEKAYNDLLNRYCGDIRVSFAVDGAGLWLQGVQINVKNSIDTAKSGIVLTIDKEIQQLVEDLAPSYLQKGAVVILDPRDSSILAMASFPSFQPDTIAQSITTNDGALVNRALSLYDCGSIFKIITTAAALDAGTQPQQEFTCPGGLTVGESIFHCHYRLGHQKLDLNKALTTSCNLYYIQVAQKIGAQAVYDAMKRFGLFDSIVIADGIETGTCVVPSLSQLQQSPAALANLSFGQGRLLISPLHAAQMTATIANNGVLCPACAVKGTTYTDETLQLTHQKGRGERIISSKNAKIIQEMMKSVVTNGTGQKAMPKTCTAAGKTGTAETGQRNDDGTAVVQSWFTGYIPAENPQYVITVFAENAEQTGADTAGLFCEISNNLIP